MESNDVSFNICQLILLFIIIYFNYLIYINKRITIPDKISVVIPTYNREKLIIKAIKSALNQTYSNIEVIIVDDCSTDNTVIEVKKIHDSRIKIIKLRHKKGGNYARNKGIRLSTGEFIAFLDSDDIFYHDKLEKQINNIKNKKSDFDFCKIYIHINITFSTSFILPNRSQEESIINGDIFEELTKDNFISTQSILVKKKVIENIFFDINLPRLQDYDLLLRIIPKVKVSFTNEVLVDINIQKDSISNSLIKLQKAIKIILNKDYKISHIQKNNIKNYLNYLKMSS